MRRPPRPAPAAANIDAVVALERAALAHRSRAERISDTIMRWLGSSFFLLAHVVWFTLVVGGVGLASGVSRSSTRFHSRF
jgi:hypothetical protein